MRRRTFLKSTVAAAALATGLPRPASAGARKPPNILWISAEDLSPDLGCYGDTYADTPNIDAFAKTAVRYDRAYSHSGVCAPSRSGIITGMYPTSIGTQHMRCAGIPTAEVKCFPEYLRAAGYFCTNNRKTDYQFEPPLSAWDENGKDAHWRQRDPAQPFFAVFNLTICHESQVRSRDPERLQQIAALGDRRHDPAKAPLPPYHADTPATRADWAQYYDVVSLMDLEVGAILAELEADGLAEDTIVWFWGDHGRGLTRGKRWLYESGTRIPLLVHVPEKYREWVRPEAPGSLAAGANGDLVSFIDFAPTMLSLAGVPLPGHLQGQSFLGRDAAPPRQYVYGARDRMDEAYDCIRTVRDKQYRYFRNYMPWLSYAQRISYMDEMPMAQDLRRLHAAGGLNADQAKWFAPRKPLEELYDLAADPHELNNLAGDPRFEEVLLRLRAAHHDWAAATGDTGLIPEPLLDAMKWPGGEPAQCAPVTAEGHDGHIALACATPGASINYRWDDAPKGQWRLYTQPLSLREGQRLTTMANRIGFRDSVETQPGETSPPAPKAPAFWGDELRNRNLLERLRALRALDFNANDHVEHYLEALADPEPAMRHAGILALHHLVDAALRKPAWTDAVTARLQDESPAVRVAAAHALSDWGAPETGIPVLVAVLKESPQNSTRLQAAIALAAIGTPEFGARPALEAATKDSWTYVVRVAESALRDRA